MKLRVLLLGLLAFALALLVVLPARWVGSLMPAAVQCAQWRGTLWNGRCQQLQVIVPGAPPIAIESAGWKLHPAALLRLAFSADVALTDSRGDATGSIELTRNGQLSLRGASARALLSKQLFPVLPTGWNGRLEVQDLDFDWFDRMPRKVEGELRVFDLRDGNGRELGNYHITFPPMEGPPFRGKLVDNGGPYEVDGELQLTAERRWVLEGRIKPRNGSAVAVESLSVSGSLD